MKNRPLKYVGVFLSVLAIYLAWGMKEEPQTKIKHQPLVSQQMAQQNMLKPHVQPKTKDKQSGTFVITTKAMMGSQQKANTEQ